MSVQRVHMTCAHEVHGALCIRTVWRVQEAAQLLLLRTTAIHQVSAAAAHAATGPAGQADGRSCAGGCTKQKKRKRRAAVRCGDDSSVLSVAQAGEHVVPTVVAACASDALDQGGCAQSDGAGSLGAARKKRKTRHKKKRKQEVCESLVDEAASASSRELGTTREPDAEAELVASGLVEYVEFGIWAAFVPNVVSFSTVLNCCTKLVFLPPSPL
jgi:hypothetical protein